MITRTLSKEDAKAFIDNMRWFADVGPIKWKKTEDGSVRVTAPKFAWSWWCG
jgi:hypothetical protein